MAVTLGGTPIEVSGSFPKVGDTAPDFKLVSSDLSDVSLADFAGKKKLLSIVPSLDTGVFANSTKVFNDAALNGAVLMVISADLPFAQGRFCTAEGTKNSVTLSTMRGGAEFKRNYGVDITSGPLAGVTARAVVVLDENNKVLHAELVPEIKQEPNYEAALAALK